MDEEFKKVIEPVMKYLAENHHPHVKIIVDSTNAELVEGLWSHNNSEFLKD